MGWKRAMEEERAALSRIVALLCALAVLAERAANRSPVVRSLVLWLLRRAEAVAREFVEGDAHAPTASMTSAGGGPLDAMRLALSLRALARLLERQARRLAATVSRAGSEAEASRCAGIPTARDALACLSRLAAFAIGASHPAPDTS